MNGKDSGQITELLNDLGAGNRSAQSKLIPLVYPELRRIAARYMRRERPDHTLQATALVNEAYLRVVGQIQNWQNRAHFFAIAAELMREILVDHARKRQAAKRGGGSYVVNIEDCLVVTEEALDVILDVDRAIGQLAALDARQADMVVYRFFGGLTEEEIAEVLNVSVRTVKRDWKMAKAWLHGVLARQQSAHDA
jgi:RNA polymerase sigma-70 factor (ECF subfamily)